MGPVSETRSCDHCGGEIPAQRNSQARFCGPKCRRAKYLSNHIPLAPKSFLGAVNELIVCADFLAKQNHVFRNVSQHGPCDIVILKNDKCYRVEVKSGRRLPSGLLCHSPLSEGEKHDILAVVLDGKPIYLHELP